MKTLSPRQQEVFEFLSSYIRSNTYPPTLQEIARAIGVKGNRGVLLHLGALERKGWISRAQGAARSIVLKQSSDKKPAVRKEEPKLNGVADRQLKKLNMNFLQDNDCQLLPVYGEAMVSSHILSGDHVVVQRSLAVHDGDIVVFRDSEEYRLGRYYLEGDEVRLKPENPLMKSSIYKCNDKNLEIVGKITGLVRHFENMG